MWYNTFLEKNKIPDVFIRIGIRKLLKQRLKDEDKGSPENNQKHLMQLIEELKSSPIAINTQEANEQHYEVPTEFYQHCLGKHLKYSSGYWKEGVSTIDTSEKDMLELTCERAELQDGQDVLELGCGWGSLSLFMAARYSKSRITVVSNSKTQKTYIDNQATQRGITNLTVITVNMNDFKPEHTYDRVVSVEMFEHMRNYKKLMLLVANALKPQGKLFVHIFTHKELAYKFEVLDETDWMSKYFFTGGIMPSDDLLLYFNENLSIEKHWRVSGMHYSKTSEAWLKNMDKHKKEIMTIFEITYGKKDALKWWVYWRIFYMACAELWGYNNGEEWIVSHYLFNKN
ncbi:SAM-dependent methyltransferase [Aurantibacillus circumpalustris]|uniref:SAM-dependent methyltransferase n=1 Tax=Aurantibacillus circumpalustris TaxID=3036359 RepID=UPI00295B009C|nr:class I SAM-dependent methyltransferase [Aurantibacillus circumpalustris]